MSLTNGHATNEGLNGTLAAGVQSVLWDALGLDSDATHHNETATNRQCLVGLSCNEELSTSVDVHDTVVFLLGDILGVAKGDDSRVGADNVQLAKVRNSLSKHRNDVFNDRDISHDGNCITSRFLNLGDNLIESSAASELLV
jgi:hypothetical protein